LSGGHTAFEIVLGAVAVALVGATTRVHCDTTTTTTTTLVSATTTTATTTPPWSLLCGGGSRDAVGVTLDRLMLTLLSLIVVNTLLERLASHRSALLWPDELLDSDSADIHDRPPLRRALPPVSWFSLFFTRTIAAHVLSKSIRDRFDRRWLTRVVDSSSGSGSGRGAQSLSADNDAINDDRRSHHDHGVGVLNP